MAFPLPLQSNIQIRRRHRQQRPKADSDPRSGISDLLVLLSEWPIY